MSFDEARRALGVSEAELEKLVAAGEIASVKEGDTLYFTADVIARYKDSRDDPTVLLADEEINLLDDDGVEEIDLLGDDTALSGVGGDEISFGDDLDLSADDLLSDVGGTDAADTVLNMDGLEDSEATTPVPSEASSLVSGDPGDDTLLDTELLDLGDDDDFSVDDLGDLNDDYMDDDSVLRGGGARVMQMKRRESHAGWTAMLAIACVLLLLPLGVLINLMFLNSAGVVGSGETWISKANVLDGFVRAIAGVFG